MIGGNLSVRNIPPMVARKTDVRQNLGEFPGQVHDGASARTMIHRATGPRARSPRQATYRTSSEGFGQMVIEPL